MLIVLFVYSRFLDILGQSTGTAFYSTLEQGCCINMVKGLAQGPKKQQLGGAGA